MKKINILLLFIIFTLFVSSTINAATGVLFTDTTSVADDITNLNLDPSDYVVSSNSKYDHSYAISMTESYQDDLTIDGYIYIYNSYKLITKCTRINLSVGNEANDYLVNYLSGSQQYNISKYKIENINTYSASGGIRKYTINSLYIDETTIIDGLSIEFQQDGNQISINYDSMIIVTEKYLFSYSYDNNFASKFNWNSLVWSLTDNSGPEFFFLNFSTNKEIDKILEIDVTYQLQKGTTDSVLNKLECLKGPISKNVTTVTEYDILNPKTIYNEESTYDWFGKTKKINLISTPAKERFTDNEINYCLTEEAIASFEYDHSVIIDVQQYHISSSSVLGTAVTLYTAEKYTVDDLSITRIKYTVDDKVYNARTNSGKLISSTSGNGTPDKTNWWDELCSLISNLTGLEVETIKYIILATCGVFLVGILSPIIIPIAKGVLFILFLPFKILFKLFGGKA